MIYLSFLFAFFLQIIPWPEEILFFKPNWVLLVLIYWIITLPHRINIGTGFLIGVTLDISSGSILGIHALSMSIISCLIRMKLHFFRNLVLWCQIVIVILLSIFSEIIIFLLELLIINVFFRPEILWSSFINGILWPWIFLLINRLRKNSPI